MKAGEVLWTELAHPAEYQRQASPTAIIAVVLVLGARPFGQASRKAPGPARHPADVRANYPSCR